MKRQMKRSIVMFFLLLAGIFFVLGADSKKANETIYVVGVSRDSSKTNIPGYWKNEEWISLPKLGQKNGAYTQDIYLIGEDLYISGSCETENGRWIGGYWINGKWVGVSREDSSVSLEKLTIIGNDKYIYGDSYFGDSQLPTPGYWKNGKWKPLPLTVTGEETLSTGFFVFNRDIYVTGVTDYNSGMDKAGYWKNGEWISLPSPNPSRKSWAFGLFLDVDRESQNIKSDIYVWGQFTNDQNISIPGYWKNGVWTSLLPPDSQKGGEIFSLLSFRGDLYIIGVINNETGDTEAGYWHNGQWVKLPHPAQAESSEIDSLIIVDGDIYATGSCYISEVYVAVYWKNGVLKKLPSINFSRYSWGSSILVVRE